MSKLVALWFLSGNIHQSPRVLPLGQWMSNVLLGFMQYLQFLVSCHFSCWQAGHHTLGLLDDLQSLVISITDSGSAYLSDYLFCQPFLKEVFLDLICPLVSMKQNCRFIAAQYKCMDDRQRTEISMNADSVVQRYAYYNPGLGRSVDLNSQDDGYSSLEQRPSLNHLLEPKIIESSQPGDFRDRHRAQHSVLWSLGWYKMERILKGLRNTIIYDVVYANVLVKDSQKITKSVRRDYSCCFLNSVNLPELFFSFSFQPFLKNRRQFWTAK